MFFCYSFCDHDRWPLLRAAEKRVTKTRLANVMYCIHTPLISKAEIRENLDSIMSAHSQKKELLGG
jgi:hypothetical protein